MAISHTRLDVNSHSAWLPAIQINTAVSYNQLKTTTTTGKEENHTNEPDGNRSGKFVNAKVNTMQ